MVATKDIRKKALETYYHEGDALSQRIDWFLIFHAILIEGFVAGNSIPVKVTIGTLGWVVSFLWFIIGLRQNWNMRNLIEAVIWQEGVISENDNDDDVFVFHKRYTTLLRKRRSILYGGRIRAVPIFAIVIPAAIFFTWLVLLWTALGFSLCYYLIPLVILIVVTCFSRWITEKPKRESGFADYLYKKD